MNHSKFSSLNRSRVFALGLAVSGIVGLLAACSSDDNASPNTPPPVTTGGGGSGARAGAGDGDAGEVSNGGTAVNGGAPNGGSTNGGDAGETSEGGAAGEAGAGPGVPECTLVGDSAFLNQPATGFHDTFNNTARLGAHAQLPALP